MEEIIEQLNDILDGKRKADNAHPDVQKWLQMTCYMYASDIAGLPTKEQRHNALEFLQQEHPVFYDDVSELAKKIFKERKTK